MTLPHPTSDRWLPRPSDFPGKRPHAFMMTDEELANSALFRMRSFRSRRTWMKRLMIFLVGVFLLGSIEFIGASMYGLPVGLFLLISILALAIYNFLAHRLPLNPNRLSRIAGISHRVLIDLLEAGFSEKEFIDSVWAGNSSRRERRFQFGASVVFIGIFSLLISANSGSSVIIGSAVLMGSAYFLMMSFPGIHSSLKISRLAFSIQRIHKQLINNRRLTARDKEPRTSGPIGILVYPVLVAIVGFYSTFPDWIYISCCILGGMFLGFVEFYLRKDITRYEYDRMLRQIDSILYWVWRLEHDPPVGEPFEFVPPKRRELIGIGNNPAIGLVSDRK